MCDDLIARLSNDLVALNNAKPRLPTKEEIAEVLRPALAGAQQMIDPGLLAGFPTGLRGTIEAHIKDKREHDVALEIAKGGLSRLRYEGQPETVSGTITFGTIGDYRTHTLTLDHPPDTQVLYCGGDACEDDLPEGTLNELALEQALATINALGTVNPANLVYVSSGPTHVKWSEPNDPTTWTVCEKHGALHVYAYNPLNEVYQCECGAWKRKLED